MESMNNVLTKTARVLGFTPPEHTNTRAMAPGVLPPARSTINSVSPDTALGISAVSRCVSIISNSITQMNLNVKRGNEVIDTPALVRSPNVNDTQQRFIEETVVSLATHGNAYWRVYKSGEQVMNLEVLDPDEVTIRETRDGNRTYFLGSTKVDVKHLKLMSRPGLAKGLGPIQLGQTELIGFVRLRSFADQWFTQGVPTGMLRTDQHLNADQSKDLAEAWKQFVADNDIMVAHSGLEYEHLHMKPVEAQYLELQQWYQSLTATLFGVPSVMLGVGIEGTSMTYTNAQEQNLQFLQNTLIKYMNEIESALTELLPRGQEVKFNEKDYLRMNSELQTNVLRAQIEAGIRTRNEVRAEMGLEPIEGGDILHIEENIGG